MPSKSAKYRLQALARAKKALGKFSGELANPILVNDWPGLAGPMFSERDISEKRQAKLEPLLAHYRIQPNDRHRWIRLSTCLAVDLIPGMIAIKVPAKEFSTHKNREWTLAHYSELVGDVDAIRAAVGPRKKKIYSATSQLIHERPEKWGAFDPRSLVTRYHEGKRELRRVAKLKVSAQPLSSFPFPKDVTTEE
jgi:hypothetical protein